MRLIEERGKTADLVAKPPAMQARPADARPESGRYALVAGDSDRSGADPDAAKFWRWPGPGGQKEEARPFLVGVTEETTVGIGPIVRLELFHAATLGPVILRRLNISGNYN
jgi:hypothetical protein